MQWYTYKRNQAKLHKTEKLEIYFSVFFERQRQKTTSAGGNGQGPHAI